MALSTTTRLRYGFYLSIADLFIGASGMLLCLIILASEIDDQRVPRFVDIVVTCERIAQQWAVRDPELGTPPLPISQWINSASKDALLLRVGLLVERNEMDCYREFDRAARRHNRGLAERGTAAASMAIVFMPDHTNADARVD